MRYLQSVSAKKTEYYCQVKTDNFQVKTEYCQVNIQHRQVKSEYISWSQSTVKSRQWIIKWIQSTVKICILYYLIPTVIFRKKESVRLSVLCQRFQYKSPRRPIFAGNFGKISDAEKYLPSFFEKYFAWYDYQVLGDRTDLLLGSWSVSFWFIKVFADFHQFIWLKNTQDLRTVKVSKVKVYLNKIIMITYKNSWFWYNMLR